VPTTPTALPTEPAGVGLSAPSGIVPTGDFVARGVARAADAAAPVLLNHGGPIIGSVEVVPIYWGAAWASGTNAQLASQLDEFFDFIVTSAYLDLLREYSTATTQIRYGRRVASARVAGSEPGTVTPSGRQVTDAQIGAALQALIANNTVPATTANTVYFIFLPPNVTSLLGDGSQSCAKFCGYHNHIGGLYYAVIPFANCSGCVFPGDILDTLTEVVSHELAEAITDPALNAWWDPINDEIGDICNRQTTRVNGFLVQTEWSNARKACVVAPVSRIAVLRANGEALVKEGVLSAGWTTEHTGVTQVAVFANRIAVVRANGDALVKEGNLSAGWITEHTGVKQVALAGDRIAVLRTTGEALVKEGGLSTGWITEHTDVIQVALSGDRIAVLRANGEALVKRGGLSTGWITEHTDVIQVALSDRRIAVLRANGEALVKEGGLSTGWTIEHTDVIQIALSGNRIAVLRASGEALVKEGGLSTGWTTVHTQVKQVALSGDRIAVLRTNGEAVVKEGDISAGWITEHTSVRQLALSF